MKKLRSATWRAAPLVLVGCASITGSSTQPVSVKTLKKGTDVVGATCTLANDKGSWTVTTPGTVMVGKSINDLAVDCRQAKDVAGAAVYKSSSNAGIWGNILIGGGIGALIDAKTGAGFNYPAAMTVELADVAPPLAKKAPAVAPAPGNPIDSPVAPASGSATPATDDTAARDAKTEIAGKPAS